MLQRTSRKFRCVETITRSVIDSNAPKVEPTGLSLRPASRRIRQLGAESNLTSTIRTEVSKSMAVCGGGLNTWVKISAKCTNSFV
ncbi:hypothetical protein D4R75_11375 [bacterium]|nr:MAG: hypothetical protein D4R75_11375 [bacterium]